MAKKTIKLSDLANRTRPVDVSETEQIEVRALNLREIITLFVDEKDAFLPLYSAGLDGKVTVEQLGPFLLTSPALVARIIAMASDEPESAPDVEKNMAATVQLIALSEIWQISIPDQKKARQLLSEVTSLLQKASDEEKQKALAQQTSSPTTSQPT